MQRLTDIACRRPWRVLAIAGVIFVVAVVVGGAIVNSLQASLGDFEDPSSQTAIATRMLQQATGAEDDVGMVALLKMSGAVRGSAAAVSREEHVAVLMQHQPGFLHAYDYVATEDSELVSRDGRETLVLGTFRTRETAYAAAQRMRVQLRGEHVSISGLDVVFEELTHRSRTDLERAALYALPLLLILSLWVFGGLVAAVLPLLIGVFAVFGTFLCLQLVTQLMGISVFALNLVSALGLGLAIDYSLFVVWRHREELERASEAGATDAGAVRTAVTATMGSAGRTVVFSSLTVAAAMASLCVFPLRFLYSMGIAGALTALIAGAAALTVLPAVLVVLGERINALPPPGLRRRTGADRDSGRAWARLARVVMRRPGPIAAASAVVLLLVGSPVHQLGLTPASTGILPTSSAARQVEDTLTRNFAANPAVPIVAVARAPVTAAVEVEAYAKRLAAVSGEPGRTRLTYAGHSTWTITIPPVGDPFGAANERLLSRLRAVKGPFPAAVGGITAWFADQLHSLSAHLPLALLIVALTMFATIFAMTGSAVLPIKTILMNLLTLAATTGLLVVAFQSGGLSGLLAFRSNGGLEPSNLVLLVTLAFALSSDYAVFLLARIKEAHDSGLANREAVAVGMQRTGRLVSAAAMLFCVAMGALVTSSILSIKELGFGAAVAVAIDATVVRALLVPSLMALLGDWNWWAPGWLRRMHARAGLRH
jgi:RND superfamily putative drug exporter